MAVGPDRPDHPDALSELGRVAPPEAEVLESAREALWSLVAAEALPLDSGRAAQAHQPEHDTHRNRDARPDGTA
jgi:hypothetical protein